jgi:hypothetical protein
VGRKKGKGGRTPKLTPEAQKAILDAVAAGTPRKYAAARAGVDDSTVRRWVGRGRAETSGQFRTFYTALKKAEADGIAARVARIAKAGQGGVWQADAWWLERCCSEEFGTNRHELVLLRRELAELRALFAEMTRGTNPSATPGGPTARGPGA